MRRLLISLVGMAMLTWLFGCDWFAQKTLKPGESTVADVRKIMGRPEMIWEEADGSQVLEYPRAPAGHETYMVDIGADGRYRGMRNVLVKESFDRVQPGMSRDDLRRLLGKPTEMARFARRQEDVWSWRFRTDDGRSMFFNAHLAPDGRVRASSVTADPQTVNTSG